MISDKHKNLFGSVKGPVGLALIAFAVVSLITSFSLNHIGQEQLFKDHVEGQAVMEAQAISRIQTYLQQDASGQRTLKPQAKKRLKTLLAKLSANQTGIILGPFKLAQDGTTLAVNVRQALPTDSWSFLTFALLDQNKRYLTGFGDGLWDETGYDGGYWHEADESFDAKITVPEAGRYYLSIRPESDLSPKAFAKHAIFVTVTAQAYSPIPHFAAGIIALIVGVLLNLSGGGLLVRALKES